MEVLGVDTYMHGLCSIPVASEATRVFRDVFLEHLLADTRTPPSQGSARDAGHVSSCKRTVGRGIGSCDTAGRPLATLCTQKMETQESRWCYLL